MEIINSLHHVIIWLNGYIWGLPMLLLLVGSHFFFTVRLSFVQIHLPRALKLSVSSDSEGAGDVNHFASLSIALAATLGAGTIVGAATALALGGPGALLWMWFTGIMGISTKYAEALLAVKYRIKTRRGSMLGGPMYTLDHGMHLKWLAVLFCVFTVVAAFGIGAMAPANVVASLMQNTFKVEPWVTGACMAALVAMVIVGGVKSIADVCTKLVPCITIFYLLGCAIILILDLPCILPALKVIVSSAFSFRAAGSGFVGAGILAAARYGITRGHFPDDAGFGSAPIAAAAARSDNPVRQALVSSTGTLWDSVVIGPITGLVLVTGVIRNPAGMAGLDGLGLAKAVFSQIPLIGPVVLTVGLLCFGLSLILGWTYYGERAIEYLFKRKAISTYRYFWILAIFFGSFGQISFIADLGDLLYALMTVPNLISLFFLNKVVVEETKKIFVGEAGIIKSSKAVKN